MPPMSPISRKRRHPSWEDLPRELRQLIFKSLIHDDYPLSRIATVSREWQAEIEPVNFARIRLTPARLVEFPSIIRRNRALVRYIWFCLELADYDCTTCYFSRRTLTTEEWEEIYPDILDTVEGPITQALQNLFLALSTWEPTSHLTLDISLYSPSDFKHWFPYLTFMPDTPWIDTLATSGTKQAVWNKLYHDKQAVSHKEYHDSRHGWVAGLRQSPPPRWALHKLFHEVMEGVKLQWFDQLPLVPAITSVLLRQQNFRRWSPKVLAHMLARFPSLQEFHYEPWREWCIAQHRWTELELQYLLEYLPRHNNMLEKLVFFENFNQQHTHDLRLHSWGQELSKHDSLRKPTPAVSRAVAIASLGLKHVAASYLVDANQFFRIDPSWEWRKLTSLQLTSSLLTPDGDSSDITGLLQAAAAAAAKMPRLEIMEIWNGRKDVAGRFRYHACRSPRPAKITWRGTWRLNLDPSVIQAWETTNAKHCSEECHLDWVQEGVDGAAIKSHGDAIHHLLLSSQVIRPISLQQIQMEQDALEGAPTE